MCSSWLIPRLHAQAVLGKVCSRSWKAEWAWLHWAGLPAPSAVLWPGRLGTIYPCPYATPHRAHPLFLVTKTPLAIFLTLWKRHTKWWLRGLEKIQGQRLFSMHVASVLWKNLAMPAWASLLHQLAVGPRSLFWSPSDLTEQTLPLSTTAVWTAFSLIKL